MTIHTKVLFLAVDAGDAHLIRKWASDGTLKTFRNLLEKGLVGATASLDGFYEGATWPSFYTGLTPAHHGFHRLTQLKPGTYDFYRCYPGEIIRQEPFWNHLSRSGRRVAVLDIPLSGISRNINGIQTVEWGSHDPCYGFCTWPRTLKDDILSRFGQHPLRQNCDSFSRCPEGFSLFKDQLLQGVRQKTELTNHYLNSDCWDFFAQVFTESHCVGHQCWHLHDPSHPSHEPECAAQTGNPIRDVYMAIDAAIGEILTGIDDNTVVVVLASHRMAHNYGAQFLLPAILQRLHMSETSTSHIHSNRCAYCLDPLDAVLGWSWRHMPQSIKETLAPSRDLLRRLIDGHRSALPSSISGVDLKKSKCFTQDNGLSVGGIRVNLAGREPGGVVEPGMELEAFCKELAENLLEIVDGDTGIPMIKSVKRTADLYPGENLDHLPDLLVEWNDEKPVGNKRAANAAGSRVRLFSPNIGVMEGVNSYCRTGDHRAEGLFIAFGGGIKAGRMKRTVSIMDFAPTFAGLLGVELPYSDGGSITEILEGATRP